MEPLQNATSNAIVIWTADMSNENIVLKEHFWFLVVWLCVFVCGGGGGVGALLFLPLDLCTESLHEGQKMSMLSWA